MADWMRARTPDDQVEMLARLLDRGRTGGAPDHLALAAFIGVLDADLLAYPLRRDLYASAKRRGHEDLAQLFLSAQPAAGELLRPPDLLVGGRALTLGERKQLARGGRRDLLDRLLRDPDPQVVRALLANPRLTEANVVFIAARRPTSPDAQRVIFASRRWIARYRVRRALVLNPHTPADLAIRLLGLLSGLDLEAVAHDAELGAAVREAAARLLDGQKKRARGAPTPS
jgi:hypothetical protein